MSNNQMKKYIKVAGLGLAEFDLTLSLTSSQATQYGINMSVINSINDCQQFLVPSDASKNKTNPLVDLIKIRSNNSTVNSLLFINKAFKKKAFIELICLHLVKLTEEAQFMKEVIKYVTELNFLFLIENDISKISPKINLIICIDDVQQKIFCLTDQSNQETKVQSEKGLYEQLAYEFHSLDFFYSNLNEIIEMSKHGLALTEFTCLLTVLAAHFPQVNTIITYPNIVDRIGMLDMDSLDTFLRISELTDTFIFEKKEALYLFNLVNQLNSQDEKVKEEKNEQIIFLKLDKTKKPGHPKIGIFIDEFKRVSLIQQQSDSGLIVFHKDYTFDLIPKNVSTVMKEEYQKLIFINYEYLKSIFFGGFFSRLVHKKSFLSCYTAGVESAKRIIELLRFKMDFPSDPNFYLIKIKAANKINIEDEAMKNREHRFVLDCVNSDNSKLKTYNSLYDSNMESFYNSIHIRTHLKKVGFINKKGVILEDPDVKKLGVVKNKKLIRKYDEQQKDLLKIHETNVKRKIQISTLFNGDTTSLEKVKISELENFAKVLNFNPTHSKKLPSIKNHYKMKSKRNDLYAKAVSQGEQKIGKSPSKNGLKPIINSSYAKLVQGGPKALGIEALQDKPRPNGNYDNKDVQNIIDNIEQKDTGNQVLASEAQQEVIKKVENKESEEERQASESANRVESKEKPEEGNDNVVISSQG